MRVASVLALTLTASALVLGCGQSAITPPKPESQADAETRVAPQKQPRDLPRLIAPPPKYGNKIVMAQARTGAREN